MIKQSHIGVLAISEGGRRENGAIMFEEILVKVFFYNNENYQSPSAKNFQEHKAEIILILIN